jgi:hypothetical protein
MAYLLPYLLTPFAHTVYRFVYRFFYCVIDCTFVYPMYNSVLLFFVALLCFIWPGRSCKLELVLNWPTWLNKGDFIFFSRDYVQCLQKGFGPGILYCNWDFWKTW